MFWSTESNERQPLTRQEDLAARMRDVSSIKETIIPKANSFFGCFSISTGVLLISFIHFLAGFAIYFALQYLRPSLYTVAFFLAAGFILTGIIGLFGTVYRSEITVGIFFVGYLVCTYFLLLCVLDFTDMVHFMPKAPTGPTESFLLKLPKLANRPQYNKYEIKNASMLTTLQQPGEASNAEPTNIYEKIGNIYDKLPFVPHNETDGQSEEVSRNELPPDVQELSPEKENEVIAIAKMQKRPMKLLLAAFFGFLVLFYFYFIWIILTFLLNRCTRLDETMYATHIFVPYFEE